LKGPFHPNYWRASTDNDRGCHLDELSKTWMNAGAQRKLINMNINIVEEKVEINVEYQLPTTSISTCYLTYRISGDGKVHINHRLCPGMDLPVIPEVGMELVLQNRFQNMKYYGKGPVENYCYRSKGTPIGIYTSKVENEVVPYLKPQECGNRTAVRWFQLQDSEGVGICFYAEDEMEFSALPYTSMELQNTSHYHLLKESDKVVVKINKLQMGVGGDDSWGAMPHKQYLFDASKEYSHSFSFKAY
jgi:beta-galactosidase